MHKRVSVPVRVSGRLTLAQRFIAGNERKFATEVRETDDWKGRREGAFSRPLHGLDFLRFHPSSELLGYCQSSAARTGRITFCAKPAKIDLVKRAR